MKLILGGIEEHTPVLIREKTEERKLPYQMKIVQIKELVEGEHEFFDGFKWNKGEVKPWEPKEYYSTCFRLNVLGYKDSTTISIRSSLLTAIDIHYTYHKGEGIDYWLNPNYSDRINRLNESMYDPYNDYPMDFTKDMYNATTIDIYRELTSNRFYSVTVPIIANGVLVKFY